MQGDAQKASEHSPLIHYVYKRTSIIYCVLGQAKAMFSKNFACCNCTPIVLENCRFIYSRTVVRFTVIDIEQNDARKSDNHFSVLLQGPFEELCRVTRRLSSHTIHT